MCHVVVGVRTVCGLWQLQEAWTVADFVLRSVGLAREEEVLAFAAADTLLIKVRYDFFQLPVESQLAFRDSVLTHVKKFVPADQSQSPHPAFGRLCLVVASLTMRVAAWKDPLRSIVQLIGVSPASLASILQILTCVVEEASRGYDCGCGCGCVCGCVYVCVCVAVCVAVCVSVAVCVCVCMCVCVCVRVELVETRRCDCDCGC